MIEVEHEGVKTSEPLWRALQIAHHAARQAAILDALPRQILLRALVELAEVGPRYKLHVPWRLKLLDDLGDDARDWAIAEADRCTAGPKDVGAYLKQYIFLALVRAKVPIERRWEHLYPNVTGASLTLLVECARGLPDDRRAVVPRSSLRRFRRRTWSRRSSKLSRWARRTGMGSWCR
jgi:hypothetical protein